VEFVEQQQFRFFKFELTEFRFFKFEFPEFQFELCIVPTMALI